MLKIPKFHFCVLLMTRNYHTVVIQRANFEDTDSKKEKYEKDGNL